MNSVLLPRGILTRDVHTKTWVLLWRSWPWNAKRFGRVAVFVSGLPHLVWILVALGIVRVSIDGDPI